LSIADATADALSLLFIGDDALWEIIFTSLRVSVLALLAASPLALLLAYVLAVSNFIGRRLCIALLQGFLSFPTVVIGLLLYMLFSRQGPLGAWQLLFTPEAMAVGQMLIAFPVLAVFALSALQKNDPRARETAFTLGAGRFQAALIDLREARFGLVAALLAGFGRIISEVGCALMVGGNIAHHTRNITTAIALETGKGAFAEGIALGLVLIILALGTSALLAVVQGGGK
jgi:tungstate transport system permease protein